MAKKCSCERLEKEIAEIKEALPKRKFEVYEDAVRPDGTHYQGKLIRRG